MRFAYEALGYKKMCKNYKKNIFSYSPHQEAETAIIILFSLIVTIALSPANNSRLQIT